MSQYLNLKRQIRANTISVLSTIPELSDYEIIDAPITAIDLDRAPFITVQLGGESAENVNHRNPTTPVIFNLVINIVYAKGAADQLEKTWFDEMEEVEVALIEGLLTNAVWLDQFVDVLGWDKTEPEFNAEEGDRVHVATTFTIPVQQVAVFQAHR